MGGLWGVKYSKIGTFLLSTVVGRKTTGGMVKKVVFF
jgi:hypothetical protein